MTITGRVARVARLMNSRNANPRYRVWLEGQPKPMDTAVDTACAYDVTSWDDGSVVRIGLDDRGQIIEYEVLDRSRT